MLNWWAGSLTVLPYGENWFFSSQSKSFFNHDEHDKRDVLDY